MKKKFDEEIYFTPKQAADYFNLSLSTIKNYIYAGKLRTLKTPGGHHRIRKSEVLATLGDFSLNREHPSDVLFGETLCISMLSVFRTLGSRGELLILHAKEVSRLSTEIARAMGMSSSDIKRISMAGLMHDIGCIGVERHVLLKSGKFTAKEYESVKIHPGFGEEILDSIKELKCIAAIVAQHHERIDGKGYPKGLTKDGINEEARIISIAEAYDSMSSMHSYKKHVPKEMALGEVIRNRGSQFDSDIADLFVKIVQDSFYNRVPRVNMEPPPATAPQ